jgi:hypothetical protein
MDAIVEKRYKFLKSHLIYFNISKEDHTIFEWKPNFSNRSYIIELNYIWKNVIKDVFFHIERNNEKFVYIKKDNLIFTLCSSNKIQYQTLEAFIEQIIDNFKETYDIEVIFSFDVSSNYFTSFEKNIEELLINFYTLGIVKKVDILCKVCGKLLPLVIKTKIIEESHNFPVPIVFRHDGHAIICFIDKNFVLRGVKPVVVSG